MRLTTKSRYGTRAMLDIALNCEKGPVSLKDLAKRQGISLKYLEQLIPPLKVSGLIRSIRGAGGGYVLNRDSSRIKLREIIDVLEGSIFPVDCVDNPGTCLRDKDCVTHKIWKEIQDTVNKMLESLTLANMVECCRHKNGMTEHIFKE